MRKSVVRVFVGALLVLAARTAAAAGGFAVDQVVADLNLPADAAARLRHGDMVQSGPQESSDRELGVDLTFLVHQPLAEVLAAFYKRLPLASMRCSLDAVHLARRHCEDCRLAFCRLCDAVVHDDPARAAHRRYPLGHVAWDVAGSPSLLEQLERALAAPFGTREPAEPEPEHGSQTTQGVVLRDADSAAAKLHGRPAPVVVDSAMRARILEHFESAARRAQVSAVTPAG